MTSPALCTVTKRINFNYTLIFNGVLQMTVGRKDDLHLMHAVIKLA